MVSSCRCRRISQSGIYEFSREFTSIVNLLKVHGPTFQTVSIYETIFHVADETEPAAFNVLGGLWNDLGHLVNHATCMVNNPW